MSLENDNQGETQVEIPHYKWTPYLDTNKCPPATYADARGVENGEPMERLLKTAGKPILFDLQNTWLKGDQYAHILQN